MQAGRVLVGPDLTIPGHPEIFVIGDAAVQPWHEDRPVPGVAQGAIQGGREASGAVRRRPAARPVRGVAQGAIQGGGYASWVTRRRLSGEPTQPFRYSNHGDVAV